MHKKFTVNDWKLIIINWLAQLEDQSQFPKWKFVLQELNFHQKCETLLKDNLRTWYKSYSDNTQFPPQPGQLPKGLPVLTLDTKSRIKTKTVFDINQNRVQIVLPSNLKSNILNLEEKKQEILNYLKIDRKDKIRDNDVPLSWSHISHKLGYDYNYTLEARQSLKNWYNQYRQKLLNDWNQQNLSMDGASSNIKNISIESITIPINNNEKNLVQWLILMFDKIKEQTSTFSDPALKNYYDSFFKHFTPNVLSTNCVTLHNSPEILKKFHTVSNLKQFKKYLKSTPGLYPKLRLWAIEHNFPIKAFSIKHHVMPQFLKNYQFSSQQLQQSWNLVSINRIIHFLMHTVRLIEYAQFEDNAAVEIMLRGQPSNVLVSWGSNGLQNIVKTMHDSLNSEMFKNYPKYEQEVSENRKKQVLKLNRSKMNDKTKEILTTKRVWRHLDNKTFEYIQDPQNVENCSLDDFARVLIQAYRNYQNLYNQPLVFDQNTNIRFIREAFGRYFNGYGCSVKGFFIVDPPSFVKPLTH